ncbi:MAG: PGPGW domain-containing protein [Kofleriaceae bacterium]
MKGRSKAVRFGALALGALLVAGGIVLLFIPGPGLLISVFGLGLFAGQWRGLARVLDRAEPPLRRRARAVKRWWKARSRPFQVALITVVVIAVASAAYFAWQWWRG